MTATLPPPPVTAPAPVPAGGRWPSPGTTRVAAGVVVAVGAYLVVANADRPITAVVALVAGTVAGWLVIARPGEKIARAVALTLAVWSHGPAAGAESDRCYPARARHFLHWTRTGENRRTAPARPEQGRWCATCGAAEWCTAPDGTVHPHDYQPADEES